MNIEHNTTTRGRRLRRRRRLGVRSFVCHIHKRLPSTSSLSSNNNVAGEEVTQCRARGAEAEEEEEEEGGTFLIVQHIVGWCGDWWPWPGASSSS